MVLGPAGMGRATIGAACVMPASPGRALRPAREGQRLVASREIVPEHYQAFRAFLEQSCGIVLGDNKQYLVSSRLGHLMEREGIKDLGELVYRVQQPGGQRLRGMVIEAMTTNETQWFRDTYPFTILQDTLLPEFVKRGQQQLRIWSAACSSGQEVYSLSIALEEYRARGARIEAEIVGTDISPAMIAQAKEAKYPASTINRGLSPERRDRYFQPSGESWVVRPEIRRRGQFMVHNLLDSYASLGRFDIIFCRNVLIYFSATSRENILNRMIQQMRPGGYLIVGASESLARHTGDLQMIRSHGGVIYRLRER